MGDHNEIWIEPLPNIDAQEFFTRVHSFRQKAWRNDVTEEQSEQLVKMLNLSYLNVDPDDPQHAMVVMFFESTIREHNMRERLIAKQKAGLMPPESED